MMNRFALCLFLLLSWNLCLIAQRQKVIFDCDLGDDIDDAFALGYLLAHQDRFEILGITTCYGRTDDRAQLALKLLYETGNEQIPVYIGRNTSTESERNNWYADQFYYARSFKQLKPAKLPAADFITNQLNSYPGEIIIFSVGPVTNFGDILDKTPGILKKAKKIYAMFGSFYMGYSNGPSPDPEWNVKCDITSARKLVSSGASIVYAGLDITTMVKLDAGHREKLNRRNSPLTDALTGLYILWNHETPTLFDPVAIGMVVYPELFKTKSVHIYVDDQGYTRIDPNKPANAEIGIQIQTQEFIQRLMKTLLQQDLGR
jgi:purine nucleosidase